MFLILLEFIIPLNGHIKVEFNWKANNIDLTYLFNHSSTFVSYFPMNFLVVSGEPFSIFSKLTQNLHISLNTNPSWKNLMEILSSRDRLA